MRIKKVAGRELTPGKTVKDHIHAEGTERYVPHVLLCGEQSGPTVLISAGIHHTETAPTSGVLLCQCASLNILEKGPMVSYGVPTHNPF